MKSEKGAISVFVLFSMLFFLAFMMISFSMVQQKGKTQQGTTEVLQDVYKSDTDVNIIYSEIVVENSTDLNTVVKTAEQENAINSASYMAVDGVIYKK